MKKSAMIVSFMLASGLCLSTPAPYISDSISVANAADLEAKADKLAAKSEALDEKAAAIAAAKAKKAGDADDEEGDVAELTPVEVVTFKTAAAETVTVVTFSDGSFVLTVGDNAPLFGDAATEALISFGISLRIGETGIIASVETIPTVEIVQAPVSADAITDETIVAAVVSATEAMDEFISEAGEARTEGSSEDDGEVTDEAESTADVESTEESSEKDTEESTTSTPESAPSLGDNTVVGTSAGDFLNFNESIVVDDDNVYNNDTDVSDASPTTY